MRTILFLFFLTFSGLSHSQISVNRAYINANYGFQRYSDFGVRVQFDRYFTVGAYANKSIDKVRVPNSKGIEIYNTKLNKVRNNITLFAGVSTQSLSRISFTALAGPSFGQFEVHENVELLPHPSGSMYIVSDTRKVNGLGIGFRGEMIFAVNRIIGLNAGVLANLNGKYNYFRVHIGICFGMMGSGI